ncbi:interleukin-33 [Onychomys torridus]|uniref:interleukin-33 n=1 Tax=Onychomys torridus TaxID=38674 RepID=UPI00167FC1CD|nr:interleukin-33 [Onychomys torridus]XP_036022548.1 interleukin-33 [Onychomys torridus]XP_036022557.1 interleukin-33 [Onychomys torridus]
MRPTVRYSTSKMSPAKLSSTAGRRALVKPCKPRRSQQKTKEICHVYYMRLRSGLTIRKETCYFEKETIQSYSLKSGRKREGNFPAYPRDATKRSLLDTSNFQECAAESPVRESIRESCASLSTYDDQSVCFKVLENGRYVINVEDSGKDQEKDKMLLRYYESPHPSNESGDGVDGKLLMVNMSPIKDTDIRLKANDEDHSVELQKCQVPLPDQVYFVLHKKSSDYVLFECKKKPGTYIGVKDNQLALIEEEDEDNTNIMFKLSKV